MGTAEEKQLQMIRRLGGFSEQAEIKQFSDVTLNKKYDVYLIDEAGQRQIFKRAEADEINAYQQLQKMARFTDHKKLAVPNLLGTIESAGEAWILLSWFEGEDMRSASGKTFEVFGTALAQIVNVGVTLGELPMDPIESVLARLEKKLVPDSIAEQGLTIYKKRRRQMPLTFTNDDLLPINVLWRQDEVCLIDWGYGRTGSYTSDLGRFLVFSFPEAAGGYLLTPADGNRAAEAFYRELSPDLKTRCDSERFRQDLQAEILFQCLLSLWHLPQISFDRLKTPMEHHCYQQICELVEKLSAAG